MAASSLARGLLPLSSLMALLAIQAAGCAPQATDSDDAEDTAEEQTSEAESALRTPGALARYFHVSTSQAISNEADYTSWSARWHTIMRGRVENELFFYDRIDGTAKTYSIADDGTLTHKSTMSLPTGVDIWIRGNFYGTSEKELASYDRDTGVVNVYEVLSSGALSFRFTKTVSTGYSIAFAGYWGNGACDDMVFYNRGTGAVRYYQSTGSELMLTDSSTWQKIWDYVVPGKFNTDGYTDMLFYNQDGGEAKVYTFDGNHTGTLTYQATDWPITPYSVVSVGEFGGSSLTDDVLVYDPRNGWNNSTGSSSSNGRGTFYTSSTSGVLSKGTVYTDWQKKWTHIPVVKQPGRSTHDLLFYSDAYDVEISPVRVANDNGTNGVSLTSCQLNRWLNVANDTYRGAGIRFVWDGTFKTLNSSAMNAYACSGDPEWLKDYADQLATSTYGAPDKLVIYFRNNGGGGGCGSPSREYMVMPDFDGTSTTYYLRDGSTTSTIDCPDTPPTSDNIKLFAHEVGHYLGLGHTYWDGAVLGLPSSYSSMDVDRSSSGWSYVWDTSPTPSGDYWDGDDPNYDGSGENRCSDSSSGEIYYPLSGGGGLTLNPDRHNVMLNGVNCDFTYNLTPGQIDAVRYNLFNNRVELTN